MLRHLPILILSFFGFALQGQELIDNDSIQALLTQQQFPLVEQYLAHPDVPQLGQGYESDSIALKWLESKADLYFETGRFGQAIELYRSLLRKYENRKGEHAQPIAGLHNNLGISLGYSGRYEEAQDHYQQALDISLKIYDKDDPQIAVSYNNYGVFNERKGDYGLAQEYYEEALRIRKTHYGPIHEKVADCYNNLGNIRYFKGDWKGARPLYQKAYDIYLTRLGPQNTNVGYACMNLAITYALEGDMKRSESLFQQDLSIRQSVYGESHPLTAYCYDNLGQLYQMQSEFSKASDHYARSLEISKSAYGENHPFVAQTYGNLAKLALLQTDSIAAENYYLKAIQVLGIHDGKQWLAVEKVKDGPKAIRLMQELFQLQTQLKDREEAAWQCLKFVNQIVDYFRTSYRAEGSQLFLQESIVPFYESGIIFAQQRFEQSGNSDYLAFAFGLSEQTAAVLLRKSIKQTEGASQTEIPDTLINLEESCRTLLEFYDRQLNSAIESHLVEAYQEARFQQLQTYDSIQTHLERNYPVYFQRKNQTPISNIEDIRENLLSPEQSLIEYFIGKENVFSFLLNQDTLILTQQAKPKDLSQQVAELRQGIYSYFLAPNQSDSLYLASLRLYRQGASQFYQSLIAPIAPYLGKKLMIVPQGELGYIPFEVLLSDTLAELGKPKQYAYLAKQKTISYSFSVAQLLKQQKLPSIETEGLLAVRPSFPPNKLITANETELIRRNLGPLPFAIEEVENIIKTWPGAAKVIQDQEANIEHFKLIARDYAILHIATHAQADDQSRASERAFLAFQPNDSLPDNNYLYFNELPLLYLDADLVVLSACETGIGTLHQGEGIASLARGFTQAGARSIVTTLWSVNDAQTSKLMSVFYQYLALGIPKDEALQKARTYYLESADDFYSHPFFWGAYVAIGDMSPMPKPGASSPWLLAFLATGLTFLAIWFGRTAKLG
ncbi:MAG: tetratricopeptide repeat protein [Bacteroidia bacterium]